METYILVEKLRKRGIILEIFEGQLVSRSEKLKIPAGILTTIDFERENILQYLKTECKEVEVLPPVKEVLPPVKNDRAKNLIPPVDYCARLLNDPPTRAQAVVRLAATFAAEVRASDPADADAAQALRQHRAERQRTRWTTTTLSGKPVADAPSDYLIAEALGLYCWSRDRAANGVRNRGAWVWIQAALTAVKTYPTAAPSPRKAA